MILEVELVAYLSKFYPCDQKAFNFTGTTTVFQVMEYWQIPLDEVSIAMLDGRKIEGDTPINCGGKLQLFPSVLGG